MENLQRDMGRLRRAHSKSLSVNELPGERWSLLLVGSKGRLLNLNLRWGLLLCFLIFIFALFLIMALWHFSRFDWSDFQKSAYLEEVEKLRKENYRLKLRLAILEPVQEEDRALDLKEEKDDDKVPLKEESLADTEEVKLKEEPEKTEFQKEDLKKEERLSLRPLEDYKLKFARDDKKIAIDGFLAELRDGEYRLSFNIRNLDADSSVSGYIVSLLLSETSSSAPIASPALAVKDFMPLDPKRGQFFSIRRFKDVRFRFGRIDTSPFTLNRVFVFNEEGELLHLEDFNVFSKP